MATVSVRFAGEDTSGNRHLEALGDAVQQISQALLRMQDVSRQQCQETQRHHERRLQEVLRVQEQRLQDDFRQQIQATQRQQERRMQEALQAQEQRLQVAFRQQLQEAVRQQNKKKPLKLLQKEKEAPGAADDLHNASGGAGEEQQQGLVEARMQKLESSLERALQVVFPRVDALLAHLERPSSPQSPSAHTASSASSSSISSSGGVSPGTSGPRSLSSDSFPSKSPASLAISPTAASVPPSLTSHQTLSPRDLEDAVRNGRTQSVRRLLDAGANVDVRLNDGWSLLMLAAKEANLSIVRLLLDGNANVHVATLDGKTALHVAAENDRSGQCVALLVNAGANVNARARGGTTPMHKAAGRDNEAAVRVLLEARASKMARDHLNRAPIDLATSALIRRLLQF